MRRPTHTRVATPPDLPGFPSSLLCFGRYSPNSMPSPVESNTFPTLYILIHSPVLLTENDVIIGVFKNVLIVGL
eukprot:10320622-Heterocapsa_arctica.AAC.1